MRSGYRAGDVALSSCWLSSSPAAERERSHGSRPQPALTLRGPSPPTRARRTTVTPPIRTSRPDAAAAAPARGPRLRKALAIGLAAGLAAAGIVLGTENTAGAAAQGSLPAGTQFYKDPELPGRAVGRRQSRRLPAADHLPADRLPAAGDLVRQLQPLHRHQRRSGRSPRTRRPPDRCRYWPCTRSPTGTAAAPPPGARRTFRRTTPGCATSPPGSAAGTVDHHPGAGLRLPDHLPVRAAADATGSPRSPGRVPPSTPRRPTPRSTSTPATRPGTAPRSRPAGCATPAS